MEIRRAEPADVYDFVSLVKQFIRESNYPFKVDVEILTEQFKQALVNEEFVVFVVAEEDQLFGFLVGAINRTLFSADKIGLELGWYLLPEERNGRMGLKLLKSFEDWCSEQQVKHIVMADIHSLQDLGPLYEKKGYRLTEKAYVKEL